jgi:threonine aldolase
VSGAEGEVHRGFGSDNHAGVHPEVLDAIEAANLGHADAYGADPWTDRLQDVFRGHFGATATAFPVFNGTGANVLCIDVLGRRHEAVICTTDAHINVDECGAPERITGLKLLTIDTAHGKLEPADLGRWESRRGDEHHVQPRIVSLTESTELGTVYTPDEIGAVVEAAHADGMYVHIDGARIANAAAALGVSLSALTVDVGVDAVSFGGTKNGLMFGEVAVFLGGADPGGIPYHRKQLMQLASKMRFVSAQFEALLGPGDLWLRNATHANRMAIRLAERIEALEGVEIVHPVEANGVFARMPEPAIAALLSQLPGVHPFHVWDEDEGVVRWMCAWDTTEADVDGLADAIAAALPAEA